MEEQELDNECLDVIDSNPNMMVPWYLMAAYAYYVEDAPILSDGMFDKLAKKLIEKWNSIEHQHKDRLNLDMLHAGTYIGEYPSRVECAVQQLREVYYGKDRARAYRRSVRRSPNS